MERDALVTVALVLAFAALVTVHVTLAVGLARFHPRWRAGAALVVFPLAPYWGLRAGLRKRAWAWIVSALVYLVLLLMASR